MGEHLATPQGRAAFAERKWLSEAPNEWIKEVLGFRRFHVRGQKKVQGEWSLGLPCAEHSADVRPDDGLTVLARHPEDAALHKYPRNP